MKEAMRPSAVAELRQYSDISLSPEMVSRLCIELSCKPENIAEVMAEESRLGGILCSCHAGYFFLPWDVPSILAVSQNSKSVHKPLLTPTTETKPTPQEAFASQFGLLAAPRDFQQWFWDLTHDHPAAATLLASIVLNQGAGFYYQRADLYELPGVDTMCRSTSARHEKLDTFVATWGRP